MGVTSEQSIGIVIADSRNKQKNSNLSHSIFTQRYRSAGDPYQKIAELPTFAHSDNHAGLQLSDFICSALLFPIATQVCCAHHLIDQTHCSIEYLSLKDTYGNRLKNLQYRYQDHNNKWTGGICLVDPLNQFSAKHIF